MTKKTMSAACALLASTALLTSAAHAEDSPVQKCLSSHERAQVERLDGRLVESRESLQACASESCPSFVRGDCVRWLDEVRKEIPTVVFEALGASGNISDVVVSVEGKPVTSQLDGKPLAFDPGVYEFEFVSPDGETKTVKVLLRQGDQNKLISVDFRPPAPPQTASTSSSGSSGSLFVTPEDRVELMRPTPVLTYVFGGLAAVATASTVVFGLQKQERESCSPSCSPERVDEVKQSALFADISLGVAAGSAATAAILYFTRSAVESPPEKARGPKPVEAAVSAGADSAWLGMKGEF